MSQDSCDARISSCIAFPEMTPVQSELRTQACWGKSPRLSPEAAEILSLEDSTPETVFTLDAYLRFLPNELHKDPRVYENYQFLVQNAENGVITERTALRFMARLGKTHNVDYSQRLYNYTFAQDAQQFVRQFIPSFGEFIKECGNESSQAVSFMPEGWRKGITELTYFAIAFVGKSINGMIEGGKKAYTMTSGGIEKGDSELEAHGKFLGLAVIVSALLLKKGLGRSGGQIQPLSTIARASFTNGLGVMVASAAVTLPEVAVGPEALAGLGVVAASKGKDDEQGLSQKDGRSSSSDNTPDLNFSSKTAAARRFPTLRSFLNGDRNNFSLFFAPGSFTGDIYRGKGVFQRFLKEHPELDNELVADFKALLEREGYTAITFSGPSLNEMELAFGRKLYEAYKIMASYDDLIDPEDGFALCR